MSGEIMGAKRSGRIREPSGDQGWWVDPRQNPSPPVKGRTRVVPDSADEVKELCALCKSGRIYDVERWIQSGRPLQWVEPDWGRWSQPPTPLRIAIESKQYSLAVLLLCNGYQPDLEPQSPLDLALERRAWDYVDLLLAWGADPKRVHPESVLGTYRVDLMERFTGLGMDLTADNWLASHLAETTSNKPVYGWARRHREEPHIRYQLSLALGDAVFEDREKAVCLLLWAGADPHRKVPSLRWGSGIDGDPDEDHASAVEVAVQLGHGHLLRHLKPDPEHDDFDELWRTVCDPKAVDFLVAIRPPADWSIPIIRNISRMTWWNRWGSSRSDCLQHILDHHDSRLSTLDHQGCQEVRRDLLKIQSDWDLEWLLKTLSKPQCCDPAIFAELTRTPSIRKRMERLGLSRLLPKPKSEGNKRRRPGEPPPYHSMEWLDALSPEARAAALENLMSREELYKEVWSEPVIKVAERYGVSATAVAKWCKKLNVPRPGRGYWARKAAGQRVRKPPLPKATKGQRRFLPSPT